MIASDNAPEIRRFYRVVEALLVEARERFPGRSSSRPPPVEDPPTPEPCETPHVDRRG